MNGGTVALFIAALVNIGVGIYLSTQDGQERDCIHCGRRDFCRGRCNSGIVV